jgi:hypothetical protein
MWNAAQFTWDMQVLVMEVVLPAVFVALGALALAAPAIARRKEGRSKASTASAAGRPSTATR